MSQSGRFRRCCNRRQTGPGFRNSSEYKTNSRLNVRLSRSISKLFTNHSINALSAEKPSLAASEAATAPGCRRTITRGTPESASTGSHNGSKRQSRGSFTRQGRSGTNCSEEISASSFRHPAIRSVVSERIRFPSGLGSCQVEPKSPRNRSWKSTTAVFS